MNKQEIITIVAGDYTVGDIRDLIRNLRDDYDYGLRTTVCKDELINQLEDVAKRDLVEALNETLPSWDEEESEEDEAEDEESEDDSDDDGEGEEEEEEGEPEEE
jgi:hypothetical protein